MNLCYLAKEDWSPRFENEFFTVSIDTWDTYNSLSELREAQISDGSDGSDCTDGSDGGGDNKEHHFLHVEGNTRFPAVFFCIKVQYGREEFKCLRRYSQFHQLYNEVIHYPPHHEEDKNKPRLCIPPKTCFFQAVDDNFLNNRQYELYEFLTDLLARPGYVNHSAVQAFLELNRIPL